MPVGLSVCLKCQMQNAKCVGPIQTIQSQEPYRGILCGGRAFDMGKYLGISDSLSNVFQF